MTRFCHLSEKILTIEAENMHIAVRVIGAENVVCAILVGTKEAKGRSG